MCDRFVEDCYVDGHSVRECDDRGCCVGGGVLGE